MVVRPLDHTKALVGDAMGRGARQRGLASWEWDCAPKCAQPGLVAITGVPSPAHGQARIAVDAAGVNGPPTDIPVHLDIAVPCRQCRGCLGRRARLWINRAVHEIGVSQRTWFSTYTLRPERQYFHLELARANAASAGFDLEDQDAETKFAYVSAAVGGAFTLYLKRLRKQSGAKLRYLVVTERHKSGQPHIHAFIHETDIGHVVRKRVLEHAWHEGFSNHRLVDRADGLATARYVAKYVFKDASTRIRASLRYGGNDLDASQVEKITSCRHSLSEVREREKHMTPQTILRDESGSGPDSKKREDKL